MIHPDDQLNDDNYSEIDKDTTNEMNQSKERELLIAMWKQKCENLREQKSKEQQLKAQSTQRNQVNEKLTATMNDCNKLNNDIEVSEKQKWKRIQEKIIYVVLNSSQFQCLDENKYIPLSLSNDENHEKSCILINTDQIENIKHRIEKLKIESEDKNDGSKQIVSAINE